MEDGLLGLLGPVCEIHVFDPFDYEAKRPDLFANATRPNNIHYHRWGFRSSYDETYKPFVKEGEFQSLQETLSKLGHQNRPIDIFKIDCESCEWYSFRDWFDADIRQLLVETHGLPSNQQTALDFFYGFQQRHFYLYHKEPNIHPWSKGEGVEWAYIRLHPDFIGNAPIGGT